MQCLTRSVATALSGLLLSAACGGSAVEQGAGSTQQACTLEVAASALEGCRAPNEPGCATCYVMNESGTCGAYSGSFQNGGISSYAISTTVSECPADGPRCAQCMPAEEKTLCEGMARTDCDCSTVEPGIDPCFSPQSCGCICFARSVDLKACPPPT